MEPHTFDQKIENLRTEVNKFSNTAPPGMAAPTGMAAPPGMTAPGTVFPSMTAPIMPPQGNVHKSGQSTSKFSFIKNLSMSSPILYGLIPVVIFLVLLFVRPKFIMISYTTDDGEEKKRLHFKKILIYTLVFSIPLVGLLVYYNMKIKKPEQSY